MYMKSQTNDPTPARNRNKAESWSPVGKADMDRWPLQASRKAKR